MPCGHGYGLSNLKNGLEPYPSATQNVTKAGNTTSYLSGCISSCNGAHPQLALSLPQNPRIMHHVHNSDTREHLDQFAFVH